MEKDTFKRAEAILHRIRGLKESIKVLEPLNDSSCKASEYTNFRYESLLSGVILQDTAFKEVIKTMLIANLKELAELETEFKSL